MSLLPALWLAACGGGIQSAGSEGGDTNPPTAGTVADGTGSDIDTQTSTTTIDANWQGFADAEGPIALYEWAIGSTPGGQDLQAWTGVGTATSASNASLTLQRGHAYYVAVRAHDLANNVSPAAISDGVTIDTGGGGGGGGGGGNPPPNLASQITQWGITWRFEQPHQVGQFCNGDWWVLGPVDVVQITPQTADVAGRIVNGSMVNPVPGREHGYDSTLFAGYYNGYHQNLNAAWGVSEQSPLHLGADSSLISTISQMTPDPNSFSQLAAAAVLTVLLQEPPAGAFRPAYAGSDKTVRFTESMLNYGLVAQLAPSAGAPAPESIAPKFERVWLDHCNGWVSRFMHPVQNMHDYGRDFSTDTGSAALLLNMDFPISSKRDLMVRFVQLGIDNWGNVSNGCFWSGEGGQGSGRKFPILFAGTVLGDAAMANVGFSHPSGFHGPGAPNNSSWFGEDCQTFVVEETSPGVYNWGFGGYTAAHVGWPEWGNSHSEFQGNDHADWMADPYRRCCTANAWIGYCLAARIMGLVPAWNHQVFFDYEDRYQTFMTPGWQQAWESWHAAAWIQYRPLF